jgi:predicted ribonuclease toxin of YeeF-YezG toxin-antitoxin module
MIKAVKITIVWSEGLPDSLTPVVFTGDNVYQQANDFLKRLARNAPKKGYGYHKTKFEIEFADGTIYEGRYDLKRHDVVLADLGRHVRQFLEFYSGRRKPNHMTEQEYRGILGMHHKQFIEQCGQFLDSYEIA